MVECQESLEPARCSETVVGVGRWDVMIRMVYKEKAYDG